MAAGVGSVPLRICRSMKLFASVVCRSSLILCLSGDDSLFRIYYLPITLSGPARGQADRHGLHEFVLYHLGGNCSMKLAVPGCRPGLKLFLLYSKPMRCTLSGVPRSRLTSVWCNAPQLNSMLGACWPPGAWYSQPSYVLSGQTLPHSASMGHLKHAKTPTDCQLRLLCRGACAH